MITFRRKWQALPLLCAALTAGCAAAIPKQRFGVDELELQGVEQFDEAAIEACLSTHERPSLGLAFGPSEDPRCGTPPFDAWRWPIELWQWPWTDWPLYDKNVFARDRSRIERWYQARGYYDARVTKVEREKDKDEREIILTLIVHEGEPVRVSKIDVHGLASVGADVQRAIRRGITLREGEPFDEAVFDASKRELLAAAREASFAKATVTGKTLIDPEKKTAWVTFEVELGPACTFGKVWVTGQGDLPPRPIWAAADLADGQPFSETALQDAKRAIYSLGPFASVELTERPREEQGVVDVEVKVVPGRVFRFAVGAGMQVGSDTGLTGDDGTGDSLRLWDLHLLGKIEHRNFLGGMRRITIEDRPRLIFDDTFPATPDPELGNLLIVDFRQPAFGEARTTLLVNTRWDRGPDPFGGGFSRSDVMSSVGPERRFLHGTLLLTSTLNLNLFVPDAARPYPDYKVMYFQHSAALDLRNDSRAPKRGAYFAASFQHAGYFLPSDWDYLRLTPEARGYLPLPLGIVLAGRVRLGIMEVTDSEIDVARANDPDGYLQRLRELGPLRQRLRGGGHNSVRGYASNTLGDIVRVGHRLDSGGARQWESSLELRVPITPSFGTVFFTDAGDVTQQKRFRFDAPQLTFGIGLRYFTLVGPVRLDAGFSPSSLQTIGGDDRVRTQIDPATHAASAFPESRLFGGSGALHFTIGEAF
jgi:outer membrane protein assembly factor BamA